MSNKKSPQEVAAALCKYYGVTDVEALMETDRFKEKFAETKSKGAALMALNKVEDDDVSVTGVYIQHGLLSEWDEKAKQKVVTGEGPIVLFDGGRTKKFAEKGKTERLDGEPCETWVQVSGVKRKYSIVDDRTDYIFDGARIVGKAAPEDFPDVSITPYLTGKFYCMMKDQDRETIKGSTSNKSCVFATGYILADEDLENGTNIRINTNPEYHKEPHAKVRVRCHDGATFSLKIPIDQVYSTFGLDSDSHFTSVKEALGGQRIAVLGGLGLAHPAGAKEFEPAGTQPEDYHRMQDAINELEALDFFVEREVKGERLKFLNLKGKKNKEGKPIEFIRIAGIRVFDLFEERDKQSGQVEWKAQVHHEDLGRDPWFSAIERSGTWKNKSGEGEWVIYPGAYIKFLNHLGGKVSLPDDNPFQQLANLYQFEDEETEAESPKEEPEADPAPASESRLVRDDSTTPEGMAPPPASEETEPDTTEATATVGGGVEF